MENRWIKAVTMLPPTIKVCGSNLLTFCLRHRVALESINSPLLNPGTPITPRDLLFAVRILSTHDMKETRKAMTLKESFLLALYTFSRKRFIAEVIKVGIYFEAQSLWPRFWEKDSKSHSGIPWHLAIIAGLMRGGCSLPEAWTMPESEAVWLYIAHCKAEGSKVEIVSDIEWEAMNKFKEEENKNTKNTRN